MGYRVTANIEDEPTGVHVEDCDDLEQAQELVRAITEEGFYYREDQDNMTYYSSWMVDSVNIRKIEEDDVRD